MKRGCHRAWPTLRLPSPLPPLVMAAEPVTVVLIHSIAGSPAQWTPQLEHLRPRYDAVAVALPGHAGTDGQEDYTVEALADYVLRRVEGRGRLVLVGHSGGALVAAHLAAAHPDRVAGLLLVDPGTDGRAFPAEVAAPMLAALRSEAYPHAAAEHWSAILEGATDATRQWAMADLQRTAPDALPDFLESMGTYDAVTPIRDYAATHPVIAITTPLSDGPHALAEASDRIEVVRIEGASHWVQLDRPDAVNGVLDRLLDRLPSE